MMSANRTPTPLAWVFAIVSSICFLCAASADSLPTPPSQPTTGPGGSDYPFADVVTHRYGDGAARYWIFEPANPTPKSAPVIVFCHGWGVMSPNTYGAWIKHLVRRGNIVIYPQYQAVLLASMKDFTPYSIVAEKAGFAELQNVGHVTPQLDRVAIVGHSMGGAIVPNLAALASSENLPIPKAICCVEPDNHAGFAPAIEMPRADFTKIPAATLTLIIVGDRDMVARQDTAKEIYGLLGHIPDDRKSYVMLISDDHGSPPLIANHGAPVGRDVLDPDAEDFDSPMRHRIPNTLNYYGIWKLFDGLTDAAFFGKNMQFALGDTPEQKYMGKWSDGVPVKELKVMR
jgi:acetyl esterase/lipase